MLSKNRIKEIHALGLKKNRDARNAFVAEGPKVVSELLDVFPCTYIGATRDWLSVQSETRLRDIPVVNEITGDELRKASFLQTPQQVIAVFQKPEDTPFDIELPRTGLCLALDGLQDPGNVGTILRLADWFGIEHIVCSHDTADIYSPKVVQASMGAICRVKVCKANLVETLENMPSDIPLYGTFLDGENIHRQALTDYGIIVMGNEGNGIRPEIEKNITRRLFIPNYPEGRPTSESLNVAIATAIVCAEFRRRTVVAPSGNPQ